MGGRKKANNRYGIPFEEVRSYNKKYHDNHKKQWTTNEIKVILNNKKPLVELSIELGRSANSIVVKRREMELLEQRKKYKKAEILP